VLRKDEIEFYGSSNRFDHSFEEEWVGQVFEISKRSVTIHLPGCELVQLNRKLTCDTFGIGNSGTEEMDLVAAVNELPHQVNGLG
jgi:hypothetical protein